MTEWIVRHVYYASNANPLLQQCVAPLIAELRDRDLVARWFFIRYWVEGPHVRLRFLPSTVDTADEVTARVDDALSAFLKRRPALYDAAQADTGNLYQRMFEAEYGPDAWQERYGDAETMPFRQNNTAFVEPYEPEYDRYGGPLGIELAERAFEASSDLVLRLIATTNTHVRPVLLGVAAQVSAALCYAFLGEDERVARFFTDYRTFWENMYQEDGAAVHERFDRSFDQVGLTLAGHLSRLREGCQDPAGDRLTPLERGWVNHARALRDEVVDLTQRGELVFRRGGGEPTVITDPDTAMTVLLSSYVHMTNNRLGASILDEIYLSYLMERALSPALEEAAA